MSVDKHTQRTVVAQCLVLGTKQWNTTDYGTTGIHPAQCPGGDSISHMIGIRIWQTPLQHYPEFGMPRPSLRSGTLFSSPKYLLLLRQRSSNWIEWTRFRFILIFIYFFLSRNQATAKPFTDMYSIGYACHFYRTKNWTTILAKPMKHNIILSFGKCAENIFRSI